MTIQVEWANPEKTIILQTLAPTWTWDEFFEASRKEMAMMDEVDHVVDIIADGRHTTLPSGALAQMQKIVASSATQNHRNGGMYIVVGVSRFIQVFVQVYRDVFPGHGSKIVLARTLDEAFQISRDRCAG
jgi:hypothetical protein